MYDFTYISTAESQKRILLDDYSASSPKDITINSVKVYEIKNDSITSDVAGYSVLCDQSSVSTPNRTIETTSLNYNCTTSEGMNYFHVMAVDGAGNVGPVEHFGPYEVKFVGAHSTNKFELEDSAGGKAVYIDDKGDMYLKGDLFTGQTISSAPTDSFIIQDSSGDTVGYFSKDGDLYLEGDIEVGSDLSGSGTKLEFRNGTNSLVGFIDESGNMKLAGGYITSYSF